MTKGTCPKCRRESVTAETQNKNSSDRCPAAFLASLDVRIDVGGCLKLENVRLLDEREALLDAVRTALAADGYQPLPRESYEALQAAVAKAEAE